MDDPLRPAPESHADGTIGSVTTPSLSTTTGNKKSFNSTPVTVSNVSNVKSTPTPDQYSKVNSVQSSQ